jgi:hypothetical protein
MRVRFVKSIAAFDWDYQAGQVVDLDDLLGRAWCASGVAEPADETVPQRETTMAAGAPERSVKPRGKARG